MVLGILVLDGYTFIRYMHLALFHNVIVGNLKSFFQLDNQIDIDFYSTKSATLPLSTKPH